MKKAIKKRVLSFLLAFCLLLGLIPAFPVLNASAATDYGTIKFMHRFSYGVGSIVIGSTRPYLLKNGEVSATGTLGVDAMAYFNTATGVLTLHDYDGTRMTYEYDYDLTIKLIGENKISDFVYDYRSTYVSAGISHIKKASLTITADESATLDIESRQDLFSTVIGIRTAGDLKIKGEAKVDITLRAFSSEKMYGIHSFGNVAIENNANLNIACQGKSTYSPLATDIKGVVAKKGLKLNTMGNVDISATGGEFRTSRNLSTSETFSVDTDVDGEVDVQKVGWLTLSWANLFGSTFEKKGVAIKNGTLKYDTDKFSLVEKMATSIDEKNNLILRYLSPMAFNESWDNFDIPAMAVGMAYTHPSYYGGIVDGTGLFTFSIKSGTLPAGMTLNSTTGVVSGTPTAKKAASTFGLLVTDEYGGSIERIIKVGKVGDPVYNAGMTLPTSISGGDNKSYAFPTLKEGYLPVLSGTQSFKIKNTGTGTLKNIKATLETLSGPSTAFTLDLSGISASLPNSAETTFLIKRAHGLLPGTQSVKVTVSCDENDSLCTFFVDSTIESISNSVSLGGKVLDAGMPYLVNGNPSAGPATLGSGNCTAQFNSSGGTLNLNGYNGGGISVPQTDNVQETLTINLVGNNTITQMGTDDQYGIMSYKMGDLIINSTSTGKLTINVTSSEKGAYGISKNHSYYGDITIKGSAVLTITALGYETGYGINGNKVSVLDSANLTATAQRDNGGEVYKTTAVAIYAPDTLTVNTAGNVTLESKTGTENRANTTISANGYFYLTKVGMLTCKWTGINGSPMWVSPIAYNPVPGIHYEPDNFNIARDNNKKTMTFRYGTRQLAFNDSAAFDISESEVGKPITSINVSGGAVYGYGAKTFSSDDLYAGITISEAGIISGIPTSGSEASTATITVTDEDGATAKITINIGKIEGDIKVGDADLSGTINILDILAVRDHILRINLLKDQALINADANMDSVINILDILAIRNHILGVKLIP